MITTIMAFLHHLFAFSVASCLIYEFVAFRQGLTIQEARRIQRVDIAFGISAGLLLVVGLLRVFFFEKGAAFYSQSPMFWVKMGLFVIIGLLSIYPTIRFVRWNASLREGRSPEIPNEEFKRVRLFLHLELVALVLILFAAPALARGIGLN
jgi:putative membrane protein